MYSSLVACSPHLPPQSLQERVHRCRDLIFNSIWAYKVLWMLEKNQVPFTKGKTLQNPLIAPL